MNRVTHPDPARIDGRPLSWYGVFAGPEGLVLDGAQPATSYTEVPGMAGAHDASLTGPTGAAWPSNRTAVLHVGAVGEPWEAKARLGALLGRRVSLSWAPLAALGELRGRVTGIAWEDLADGPRALAATGEVSFALDPYLYGRGVSYRVAQADPYVFIRGNAPVRARLVLPSGATGRLKVSSGGSTVTTSVQVGQLPVTFDMAQRRVYTGSGTLPVELDSDFFELAPGRTAISSSRWPVAVVYEPLTMI